jgi:hypothetical protein
MTAPDDTPTTPASAHPEPAPAAAPASSPPDPAPAPAPQNPPAQQYQFVRSRPFQVGLAAVAGLAIGGFGGLCIGFFAGHHFDGGGHRPHGYYQDGPRRERMPVYPPRKVQPQKPAPGQPTKPNPVPSVTPTG